jgi:UDP-2,3-diacylglucosamine pyrophosphatase LpxH
MAGAQIRLGALSIKEYLMANYEQWLRKRLNEVYQENSLLQERDLAGLRLVIFSDLHKGQRDGADDFEQCEQVYLGALDHYWKQGFELVLLGDAEELWECRPARAIDAYDNVLQLERPFAQSTEPPRYLRVVGNHDDIWYEPAEVQKHLGPYLSGATVYEGLRLRIKERERDLGELFLVHGHQGTLDSDRYRKFSKWFVRHIWRPIQRFLRIKSTTPSNSLELVKRHELAMYGWAAATQGPVLIAGHTHHPVWEGLSCQQALERQAIRQGPGSSIDRSWIDAHLQGYVRLPGEKPFYFNSGCCCYSDGSITGLELASGEIRLIRWVDPYRPTRQLLLGARLTDVFDSISQL